MAIAKATNKARKRMIEVARRGSTVPYEALVSMAQAEF